MEITAANLDILFRDVSNDFQSAMIGTEVIHPTIATTLPMGNRQVTHAFIDRIPQLRRWFGNRVINNLIAHSRTLTAEVFEDTIGVDKFDIKDDNLGLFNMGVKMLGEAGAKWPDKLVAEYILQYASVTNGFDGVPNYSTAHPLLGGVDGPIPTGAPATQSNLLTSTALTWDNYVKARQTMQSWVGADGAPMMVTPNVLMVPPYLEGKAKQIVEAELRTVEGVSTAAQSNTFKGTATVVVNPWLSSYSTAAGLGNWWLLDTTKPIKPFIFHQLDPVTMTALVSPTDPNVFMNHKFVWGLESRGTSSESVWWLSLAATSEATYIPSF